MHRAIQSCHPAVELLFFGSVLLFGMVFYHPVLLGVAFVCALADSLLLRGGQTLRLFFSLLLPTWLLVVLVNTAFNHYGVTALFTLPGGNRITLEALVHGAAVGGMVVTVFLWFSCCSAVITSDRFLHVFGRRLPTAALLVSMTLRFIPLYIRRMRVIRQAQKGVGQTGGALRSGVRTLGILTTWSLENAVETADGMRARGYGLRGRTQYARYLWTAHDTGVAVWIALSDASILFGVLSGRTRSSYNPRIALPTADALSFVLYGVYALLCAAPLILELSEGLRWNRSV